jgi:hypothetical protein
LKNKFNQSLVTFANRKFKNRICRLQKNKGAPKNIYCLAQKIKLFYEEFLGVRSEFTIV